MNLIARGQYDVAPYLVRPIAECQSLAFAVAISEEGAKAFYANRLRGAYGRKRVIELIRPVYPEVASFLEARFKGDSGAVNNLSHVSPQNVKGVLKLEGGTPTPTVVGRVDKRLASLLTAAAFENEFWHLTCFRVFFSNVLDDDWIGDFDSLTRLYRTWMKEVAGPTGYNADTGCWVSEANEPEH